MEVSPLLTYTPSVSATVSGSIYKHRENSMVSHIPMHRRSRSEVTICFLYEFEAVLDGICTALCCLLSNCLVVTWQLYRPPLPQK